MTIKVVLLFALVLCLSLSRSVEARNALKIDIKPTFRTLKTQFGDYDCVDFYKQPAFDHPLLKNHTYNYASLQKANRIGQTSEIGLPGEGCPIGTVPIRKTTKEDLIRAKPSTEASSSIYRAVVRTKEIPKTKYNGGRATMSVYRPSVSKSQYSSGLMTLRNGHDSIQVGWTVNPGLYGDDQARLYTHFTTGSSSCYNTQCPGFVIVNNHIPLDLVITPVSRRGWSTQTFNFFIYREQSSGNWWLAVGKSEYTKVGFWAHEIFDGLKEAATYVEWGGETYGPPTEGGPDMGSGYYPAGNTTLDAFCSQISTVNEDYHIVEAQNTEAASDKFHNYWVVDYGTKGVDGHLIAFGGAGPGN